MLLHNGCIDEMEMVGEINVLIIWILLAWKSQFEGSFWVKQEQLIC